MKALTVSLLLSSVSAICIPSSQAALPLKPEQVVVTCFSGGALYNNGNATPNPAGFVVAQIDTRTGTIGALIPAPTSPAVRWSGASTPPYVGFHNETNPPELWNNQHLGEVFGIAVDDQTPPNIFVAASDVYNNPGAALSIAAGPAGTGGVYKLNATTGAITWGTLPNHPTRGPGHGNVCYRRAANTTGYLYVSDLENGMIYRVNSSTLAQVGVAYDHGVQGRPNESLPPKPDDGVAGMTQHGRRIWGLKTYQDRLFYAVWWEDSRNINSAESNEIWSVDLDGAGDFIPATARRRITLPNYFAAPAGPAGWSNPVASIDFAESGKMFLAERYWNYDPTAFFPSLNFGAHYCRVHRYWLSGPNWITDPSPTHRVGGDLTGFGLANGTNSAGGVAVNCDESIWATGDMYNGSFNSVPGYAYGLQRIRGGGNDTVPPGYGSLVIDYDDNIANVNKFAVGAVATVRQCCLRLDKYQVACPAQPGGPFILTGTVTYLGGPPASFLSISVVSGATGVSPSQITLPNPLANGGTFTLPPISIFGASSGQQVCLRLRFLDKQFAQCCSEVVCVNIPECCLTVEHQTVQCLETNANGTVKVQVTMNIVNNSPFTFDEAWIWNITPPGVVPVAPAPGPIPFAPPVPPGGTGTITWTFNNVSPGTKVCFTMTVHDLHTDECCAERICFVADCPSSGGGDGHIFCDMGPAMCIQDPVAGSWANVPIIFNNSGGAAQTVTWQIVPLPAGPGCTHTLPAGAFSPASGIVTVPAAGNTTQPVTVDCSQMVGPPGAGTACFEVIVMDINGIEIHRCRGVVHRDDVVVGADDHGDNSGTVTIANHTTQTQMVPIRVRNPDGVLLFRADGSVFQSELGEIFLLEAGASAQWDIQWRRDDNSQAVYVILIEVDLNFDGVFVPVASLFSRPATAGAPPPMATIDGVQNLPVTNRLECSLPPGLAARVQYSNDLSHWTEVPCASSADGALMLQPVLSSESGLTTIYVANPGVPKAFYRLQYELPPQ